MCTVGGRGPLCAVGADALWRHLLAMDMVPDDMGITWLELAVDFRLSHPGVALSRPARGAAPTMLQEMEAFRARTSVLVGQHLHPEVQTLFRPAVGRSRPLARLGITSTLAAVSFRPCWETQRWARLDDFLLGLRGCDAAARRAYRTGVSLPWVALRLRAYVAGESRPAAALPLEQPRWSGNCKACGRTEHLPRKPLRMATGWEFHWCAGCQVKRRANSLTCVACGLVCARCECEGPQAKKQATLRRWLDAESGSR